MALIPNISYSQAINGKLITFTDTSNWVDSGLDIADYTRTIELYDGKDATGNLITTLTFIDGSLTTTYALTEDKYFSAKYQAEGQTGISPKIINFGTTNFEYKLLNDLTSKGCGCGNKSMDEKVRYGFIYLWLAEKSVLEGNSARFNQNIKTSNTWLT